MGCVAVKNDMTNFSVRNYLEQGQTERDMRKSEFQTQADSCSDAGTVSARSPRQRIQQRRLPNQNNYFGLKLRKILKGSLWNGSKNNTYKLVGPGLENRNYEVLCEQKNISLFIHLMYGFPAENISILNLKGLQNRTREKPNRLGIISQKSKESHRIVGSKFDAHILLKQKVDVFVKLYARCECCKKTTIITSARALFTIDTLNCQCRESQVSVRVVKSEPALLQIWSDQLEETIPTPHHSKACHRDVLIKKQTKLRVFGCTSCWGFGQIKQRRSCKCAVCPSCEPLDCQLCHQ